MIAFMPEIYDDELCYSWIARYYCHSGYPAYGYALDDLFGKRTIHFNAEFISDRFCMDAKKIIDNIIPMEKLILNHTMFPIVRFMNHVRMQKAMELMLRQEGKVNDLLPIPKSKCPRYLRYCPCCAAEQREKYGEALWTRAANINDLDICAKHRCRLKNTGIELSSKQSPRLYIAEQKIEETEPEFVNDGLELQLAKYVTDVFQLPIDLDNNISISDFLNSKLEKTIYLSASGLQKNISLLFSDFSKYYKDMQDKGITELAQMQKIFTGYRFGLYEICQIAFFLGIKAEELAAPILPEESQEKLFIKEVAKLKMEGKSAKQIGRMLGIDHHSIQNAVRTKEKAKHDYSVRKGISKEDWDRLDKEIYPRVREACQTIYNGEPPKKVTRNAVERMIGMPTGRIRYLCQCANEVRKYEEPQEIYWARKVVWQYRKLKSDNENINYNRLCRPINLRKQNFLSSFPFLHLFCKEEEEMEIRGLLGL